MQACSYGMRMCDCMLRVNGTFPQTPVPQCTAAAPCMLPAWAYAMGGMMMSGGATDKSPFDQQTFMAGT